MVLVRHHTQQRADARHQPPDDRRRVPGRRALIGTGRRALRLVQHGDNDIAGAIHREGGGEGRNQAGPAITANARLFGRTRLAAHAEAGGIGALAGAIDGDHAHQLVHPGAGAGLEHAAALGRMAWLHLIQRGRAPDSAIDHGGIGAGEVQRGNRDTVAIADRHRPQARPVPLVPDGKTARGQFDIGPLMHAQLGHVALQRLAPQFVGDLGGYDIGGMD